MRLRHQLQLLWFGEGKPQTTSRTAAAEATPKPLKSVYGSRMWTGQDREPVGTSEGHGNKEKSPEEGRERGSEQGKKRRKGGRERKEEEKSLQLGCISALYQVHKYLRQLSQ